MTRLTESLLSSCAGCANRPDLSKDGVASVQRPDWTCGTCGRVWRHMNGLLKWWAEIRGPNGD